MGFPSTTPPSPIASNPADTGSRATNRTPRPWSFSMLDSNKEVVGSGVIVAPSASAARVSAELLLAGTNSVVVHETCHDKSWEGGVISMGKKSTCCGSALERWNDGHLHCSECGKKQ